MNNLTQDGFVHPNTLLSFRLKMLMGLVLLGTVVTHGQVIIKERIDINSGTSNEQLDTPPDVFFVAPRNGVLRLRGNIDNTTFGYQKVQLGGPPEIVLGQSMDFIHSDTTITRSFSPIVSSWATRQGYDLARNRCIQSNPVLWYVGELTFDTIYTGPLVAGDTLRFRFNANLVSNANQLEEFPPEQWVLYMRPDTTCLEGISPPVTFDLYEEYAIFIIEYADTLVRFIRPDSNNVYPTYKNFNNVPNKRNYIDLEAVVEFGTSAIPNRLVKIDRPLLTDSGGHSHDGARPMGRFVYPFNSTNAADTFETITEMTDGAGKLKFRYVASQFGGVDQITAKLMSDTTRFDTLSLMTRVPGLELLVAGSNYSKIGGKCVHHGPGGGGSCETPDNDHWAIASVIANIQNIAAVYRQQFPNEQRLNINDMSLPFGGRFDLNALWVGNSDHQYHRQGTDVDIRSTTIPDDDTYTDVNHNGRYNLGELTIDLNNNGQYDRTNTAFEEICRDNDVLRAKLEFPGRLGLEHYHLYFYLYE